MAEPVVAALAFVIAAYALPSIPEARPLSAPEPFVSLREVLPAGTLVASDASWNVAWYSDLPSVRFSGRWPEIVGIEQLGLRVGAVLVRGPYAREFEAGHVRAGGEIFRRVLADDRGFRLWVRNEASPGIAASDSRAADQESGDGLLAAGRD